MTTKTAVIALLATPLVMNAGGTMAATVPIGTTAVSKNSVKGKIGNTERKLSSGDSVFQNETIQTGTDSAAQFLFKDETALTLSANSSVVLDSLVYDPDKKSGQLILKAVSGSFRFISGSAPKKNYKIRTPVGTIGIRGTIIFVSIIRVPETAGRFRTWVRLTVFEGGATLCNLSASCVNLPAGTYSVVATGGKPGKPASAVGGACSASGSFSQGGGRSYCTVFEETGNPLHLSLIHI